MIKQWLEKLNKNWKRNTDKWDIEQNEIDDLIKQGAIIIDVRNKKEYQEGHINRAICIPEYEIVDKIEQIVKDRNEILVLYCTSGIRSRRAQKTLQRKGYQNVYHLYKGYEN